MGAKRRDCSFDQDGTKDGTDTFQPRWHRRWKLVTSEHGSPLSLDDQCFLGWNGFLSPHLLSWLLQSVLVRCSWSKENSHSQLWNPEEWEQVGQLLFQRQFHPCNLSALCISGKITQESETRKKNIENPESVMIPIL